jgi:glycosyltransferase involved in cell wall biosynthesis
MQGFLPDNDQLSGRISIVTETYPPEVNGVAHTLKQIANGLSSRGLSIQMVRPTQKDQPDDLELDFPTLWTRGIPLPGYSDVRFGLPMRNRLIKAWKEERPDAIYIATEGPLGSSALSAARALDIPTASGFHTRFDEYTRHYRVGFLEPIVRANLRRFHNRCDLTMVPTKELQQLLLSQGFERIERLSRGVDTQLFSPEKRDSELRRQWGLGEDDIAMIYVGRIASEKNIQLAIRSWEKAREQNPNTKLIMVGDGPVCETLSRQHPDIIFCGMHRGESLARHFASGDFFIFPSLSETFGNVVIEAMASGLAVLGYNEAAIREHIRNGHNGLSAAPRDEETFIKLAMEMVQRPAELRQLGIHARDEILTQDWSQIFKRFEGLIYSMRGGISREPAPAYE